MAKTGKIVGALTVGAVGIGGALAWAAKKRRQGTTIGPVTAGVTGKSGTNWLVEYIGVGDSKNAHRFRVYWVPPTGAQTNLPVLEYMQIKEPRPGYALSIQEIRADPSNRYLTKFFDVADQNVRNAAVADLNLKVATA